MKKKILISIAVVLGILVLISALIFFKPSAVQENFYLGNLHTHTTASDGKNSYQEMINEAKNKGFSFIAITDHNTISQDTKTLCPQEKEILCIIGEEVSTTEGHMLAIGIKEVVPQGLTPEETIKKIHEQGALAIPSHPAASNGISVSRIKELPVDAVECSIRHKKAGQPYDCELLPNLPHVYNSDAHSIAELSQAENKCLMPALNMENLKEAVKNKKCASFF